MPLFSIITVTKDNPAGLARTRASVEAQDFTDREWIVIDGAIEDDAGIYDAMNKGIDRASGTFMIFMNAGDVFAGSHVLTRIAREADFDFMYGDALEGGLAKPARHDIAWGMPTHHQAMIFRRGFKRYDTQYRIAADYKFTAEYFRTGTVRYLPFAICDFEPGGVSQRKTAQGRREQQAIRRAMGLHAPGVVLAQLGADMLKRVVPGVYWALRSRLKTSRA